MSINKINNNPQWQITATSSIPENDTYSIIYPKTDGGFISWYVVDYNGNEKKISYDFQVNGALLKTPNAIDNIFGFTLDLNLGQNLTASSTLEVYNLTASNFKSTNSYFDGATLTVDAAGEIVWVNTATPYIGATNSLLRFNTSTSVTSSTIKDDGNMAFIGTKPTNNVDSLFSVNGKINLKDISFNDNTYEYIKTGNGITISTNGSIKNIFNDGVNTYDYITSNVILPNSVSPTVSIQLSDTLNILSGTVSKTVNVGSTLSNTKLIISSNNTPLQINSNNKGLNKILVSDINGNADWSNLTTDKGIQLNGLTLSTLVGNGLTYSGNNIVLDTNIFSDGLTYSGGSVKLNDIITASTIGSSVSIPTITFDSKGRITSVTASTISIPSGENSNVKSYYGDKSLVANIVTNDGGTASNSTITLSPLEESYVSVFINGQFIEVGNGVTNSACYFGTSSTIPKGFSVSNKIEAGDYLYFNPSIAGFNLDSTYKISFNYLISS